MSRTPNGQPQDERQEREILNRTRMWLMCYIMDRCLSIQSGKAWMVQEDLVRACCGYTVYCDVNDLYVSQTVRKVSQWLKSYKYHNGCDGYLTSLTELLCIMSRFVGTVNPAFGTVSVESIDVRLPSRLLARPRARLLTSRTQDIDFGALYKAYDDELLDWKSVIDERHKGEKMSKGASAVGRAAGFAERPVRILTARQTPRWSCKSRSFTGTCAPRTPP